jgi:hypothetical protein
LVSFSCSANEEAVPICRLRDLQRLARHGKLIALDSAVGHEEAVAREQLARARHEQVAHHDVEDGDILLLAAPHHRHAPVLLYFG